ncbi:glutamic acid-rich protein-like [Cynara cardunculus var. scolymus]|uniref:glutamic acid-rich protein-like n=1 Tax=Cynara cardunculus var. scolymus TaxID=59895 RepID=UPI000D6266F6|nr:glutamic acid-rich protein-like [Cynara cardunculus var. scolymus]
MGGKTGGQDQASSVALTIGVSSIQRCNINYAAVIFDDLVQKLNKRQQEKVLLSSHSPSLEGPSLAPQRLDEEEDEDEEEKEYEEEDYKEDDEDYDMASDVKLLLPAVDTVFCKMRDDDLPIISTLVAGDDDDEDDDDDEPDLPDSGSDLDGDDDDDDEDDFTIQYQRPTIAIKGVALRDSASQGKQREEVSASSKN